MQKHGISQEGLKIIACATMLADHIGAVVVLTCFENTVGANKGAILDLYEILRMIGRLAFPIYCFLLVEGCFHTRNPKKYGLRLLIAAVISEIPYDLAIYGNINWQNQNVMITLLLGFFMVETMKKCPGILQKLLTVLPFLLLADAMNPDYEAEGILIIALFALTRDLRHKSVLQFFGMWCVFSPNHLMFLNWLGEFSVTIQELAVFGMVPIMLYDGRKITKSRTVQWAFYLFYPAHLLALYFIGRV